MNKSIEEGVSPEPLILAKATFFTGKVESWTQKKIEQYPSFL